MTEKRKLQSERLLQAAYELVAEVGVGGLRTRDIAERAGVNLATVHYCFASKEALLRALYDFILIRFRSESERLLEGKTTPAEKLRGRGEVYGHLLREMPKPLQVWKGFIGEAWINEEVRGIVRDHLTNQRARLATLIDEARAAGDLPDLTIKDNMLAASLMMALYEGLLFQWVVDPEAFPTEDYTRAVEQLMGLKETIPGKNN
jgi:AcrR family transcriptional regulator